MFGKLFTYIKEVIAEAVTVVKRIFIKDETDLTVTTLGIVDETQADTYVAFGSLLCWGMVFVGLVITPCLSIFIFGVIHHLLIAAMSRVRHNHRK